MSGLSVEDKQDIQELLARSAWAYDTARLDVMESCFRSDAQMRMQIAGGDIVGPFDGRVAVLDLIRGSIEAQTDQRRHVISNVFYESQSTDEAVVVSNLTLLATADGEIAVLSAGLYRDTVVREADGWQFRERFLTLDRPY